MVPGKGDSHTAPVLQLLDHEMLNQHFKEQRSRARHVFSKTIFPLLHLGFSVLFYGVHVSAHVPCSARVHIHGCTCTSRVCVPRSVPRWLSVQRLGEPCSREPSPMLRVLPRWWGPPALSVVFLVCPLARGEGTCERDCRWCWMWCAQGPCCPGPSPAETLGIGRLMPIKGVSRMFNFNYE